MKGKGKSKTPEIPREFRFCLNKGCENFYKGSRKKKQGKWIWDPPRCMKAFKLPKDEKEADSIALLHGYETICPKTKFRTKYIRDKKKQLALKKRRMANKLRKSTPEYLKGWGRWLKIVPQLMREEAKKIELSLIKQYGERELSWQEAVYQTMQCNYFRNYTVIKKDPRTGEEFKTELPSVCGNSCCACHSKFPPGFSVDSPRYRREVERYLAKKQVVEIYRDFSQGKITIL